jgi:hypothetical protein
VEPDQPKLPGAATLDADGRVAMDAQCVSCGYNLRTLKVEALCPECAQPVAYSIQGYFLRFASPRWIKGLARGTALVLIALGGTVVVGPLLSLALSIPTMMNAAQSQGAPSTRLVHVTASAQFVYHAILTVLAIIGLLAPTRRDPAQAGRARELFGFEAKTPFEEGLRRTIAWYREYRAAIARRESRGAR